MEAERASLRLPILWAAFWGLLLLLMAVGCGSSTDAMPVPSSTPGRPAGSAAMLVEPTQTASATVPGSPTPGSPRETSTLTPTPSPAPPTATPSPAPTHTSPPTSTSTTTPTSTSAPTPVLRRLTNGGCCTQPFWSPDSQQVLFIDKPSPDAPLGIWGVHTGQPEATPELVTERIAFYTADLSYVVGYGQGQTAIERLQGPLDEMVLERWTVPAGGRPISISPGRTRIAWQVSNDDAPVERRVTQIWVANFDGSDAQSVATLARGSLVDWLSEDVLLLAGRESLESRETILYTFSLIDAVTVELVRAERPRGYWLSRDGRWLVYYITFSDDPSENGLWLVRTDGTERRQLDPTLFGDYAWRDAHRLLILPFRPDAAYHELWEYDVETGQARRLTDPDVTPFKVTNADWQVSPDGQHLVFVESSDRNLWLLTLAD